MTTKTKTQDASDVDGRVVVSVPWSHSDLVTLAARWLKKDGELPPRMGRKDKRSCAVVFAEIVSSSPETPDAIGFFACGKFSILVECKISRSDFKRDAKKHFREFPEMGVGDYRYYLAPPGVISVSELPERWGLIEPDGKSIRVVHYPERQPEKNLRSEINMLWSACRRLKTNDPLQRKPIR